MALAVSYPEQTRNSRTELVYRVPGLPDMTTKNVEGLPQVRPGQNIPLCNEEWFDWLPRVEAHRVAVDEETTTRSKSMYTARQREIGRICADQRYWINSYASIFASETAEEPDEEFADEEDTIEGLLPSGIVPFILYPFQDYFITWLTRVFRTKGGKGDALLLKSREMGITNVVSQMIDYRWMTWGSPVHTRPRMRSQPFLAAVISRTEDDVDNTADPGTVFWKMDSSLRSQSPWILPTFVPGFDWDQHRRKLTLENPHNANMVKGGSTAPSFGRGKRGFLAFIDEFTYVPNLKAIWQGMRGTVRHRVAGGTASVQEGMAALNLVKSDLFSTLNLLTDTGMHPRQDQEWRDLQRSRGTEAEWAQEAGGDWFAMSSDYVYPDARKKELGDYPYLPFAGPTFCAIDDGTHWAMWFLQYIRDTGRIHVVDYYANQGKRVEFYGHLLRGRAKDGYDYGEHEQAIIRLMHLMPIDHFIGDTHGAHVEQIAGMSVIEDLAQNFGIIVNIDYMGMKYKDRMKALDDVMPSLRFNNTERVAQGLYALQNYKFRATPEGKEVAREQREPLHNDLSHAATALEFWANLFRQFLSMYSGAQIVYQGAEA